MFFALPVFAADAAAPGNGQGQAVFSVFGLEVSGAITTMWGLMLFITVVSYFASRKLEIIPHSRLQNSIEFLLENILGYLSQIMGSEKIAKRYFPLLASFFILILASNYAGLLPGAGHAPGLKAPTSTLSVTAAFAVVVFLATQYYGIKACGLSYFKRFIKPMPFLLPINILEEFTRPLSLALRLYGNVFGEEMVVAGFFSLFPLFLPVPMMLLGLLFGLIQALVFTLLASLYISSAAAGQT